MIPKVLHYDFIYGKVIPAEPDEAIRQLDFDYIRVHRLDYLRIGQLWAQQDGRGVLRIGFEDDLRAEDIERPTEGPRSHASYLTRHTFTGGHETDHIRPELLAWTDVYNPEEEVLALHLGIDWAYLRAYWLEPGKVTTVRP